MQQVCGLNSTEMAVASMAKVLTPLIKNRPPWPPKKQKRVTSIKQPTIVMCDTLDQLEAMHRRENEVREESKQMPSISQVGLTQKQTLA